ncbi:MAG: 16S rRNA (guanine(966)-N(2))-methyltransferase RsmD [Firmicutes bacterium]|nr:16S rRNA (guanine(966)-N(2))-methyltransferase RsmD [Bacillota bacterium]MCL5056861.1 16S rRNA (guanine(966)-N(2))-methyltransferase RsmD [Actinomycetota bacterium]
MRIIAGTAKKRLLKVPSGWTGRPTADRVKESLFNILGNIILGCSILDLFAGTGNIGIEALSRGAARAVFVEKDRRASAAIMQNLKNTGFENRSKVIMKDVYRAMAELGDKGERFDIVFLDPPYGMGYEVPVMMSLAELQVVSGGGLIIAESSKREALPPGVEKFALFRQERYGDTMLSFYK